jgi:HNH endonuclease
MKSKKECRCGFCDNKLKRYSTKTETYFCDITCKSKWQIFQREKLGYTKEWLCYQYFELGKNCNEIAKEIKRDGKTVWYWFSGYGIEINKRGVNYKENLVLDGSTFLGKKHKESSKEKIRQARLRDGHVPYLQNGVHWLRNEGNISPNYKGGISPERQAFYSSEEWANAVKAVWQRDNAICQNCQKNHNGSRNEGAFHIHHIISFKSKEHRSNVDNLVLLCKSCHNWVHSRKNVNKKFIKNE